MGATFVVTLREAFEAALVLGIVYTYLEKVGGRQHYRYVTCGGGLGVLASVLVALAVSLLSGPLLDLGPDLIATAVIFVAVIVLTWHGWWMQQHARAIKGEVQRRIDEAQASRRLWIIGLIAFTAVFREGSETVLFLWGLLAQATDAAGGVASWSGVAGGVLGVATAAGLGWAIFRGGKRISLVKFFAVTSLLLVFLSAGLFSAGIGKLQGLGLLPQGSIVWDTSSLLSDRSFVGTFLSGLIGYRSRPSTLEVGAYGLYLLVGAFLLFGDRLVASPAPPPNGADPNPA